MGMFDRVCCEYPLPNPEHQKLVFQTKDLRCVMEQYVVTRNGRLIRYAHEFVPEEDRHYYGTPEWTEGVVFQVCGIFRIKKEGKDIDYHGDVRLYCLSANGEDIEYTLRFTNGRIGRLI